MSKTEFRVLVSPLTKTAFAGRVKEDGLGYVSVGVRHDVTKDIYRAIIEIVGLNQKKTLYIDGVPQFEIEVRDVRKNGGKDE